MYFVLQSKGFKRNRDRQEKRKSLFLSPSLNVLRSRDRAFLIEGTVSAGQGSRNKVWQRLAIASGPVGCSRVTCETQKEVKLGGIG